MFCHVTHQMRCYDFSIVKIINEGVSLTQMSKLNRKVLSPLWRVINFYRKVLHIKHRQKKKSVIVIFVLQWIRVYLTKTVLKTKSNATFNNERSWLRWIVIKQVNHKHFCIFCLYSWKKFCYTFKASSEEVIVMCS